MDKNHLKKREILVKTTLFISVSWNEVFVVIFCAPPIHLGATHVKQVSIFFFSILITFVSFFFSTCETEVPPAAADNGAGGSEGEGKLETGLLNLFNYVFNAMYFRTWITSQLAKYLRSHIRSI